MYEKAALATALLSPVNPETPRPDKEIDGSQV
jgi:hypothetical protein